MIEASQWEIMRETASRAMERAYAPYSGYKVGAAALVDDGRIVSGCNVENASYGVGLCAECGLVSELINTGGGRLVAFLCVNANDDVIAPCGRCRQLLFEHGGHNLQMWMPSGMMALRDVLPDAFGPASLHEIEEKQ